MTTHKILYLGVNATTGQMKEMDAKGWSKLLGIDTRKIAPFAKYNYTAKGWRLRKSKSINVKTGDVTTYCSGDEVDTHYADSLESMVKEAKRRGITYGDLQTELYSVFTYIAKPCGLKTQREKDAERKSGRR